MESIQFIVYRKRQIGVLVAKQHRELGKGRNLKILSWNIQIPTLSVTLGLGATYLVAYNYMLGKVTETPLKILWFCSITFVIGLLLSFAKKKSTLLSDILYSFSVYNLVALIYLLSLGDTTKYSEGVFANLFKTVVFLALGYPIAFVTMLPAFILSVFLMQVSRKSMRRNSV